MQSLILTKEKDGDKMIGNRFDYTAYDDGTESIYDRKKDKYYYDMQLSSIEELLNDLEEENEQLKQKNKGLQSELHIFKEDVTHSNKIIDKLNGENEQLKSYIGDMEEYIAVVEEKNKELKRQLMICQDKVKGLMK